MAKKITFTKCSSVEYEAALTLVRSSVSASVSFLQAPFYGAWQEADGKTVLYYTAVHGKRTICAGLAVLYTAPGGLRFFYSPYGPIALEWSDELLRALRSFFRDVSGNHGTAFVRLDADDMLKIPEVQPVSNSVAVTASLQPRAEWLLDISGSEDDIWMGMHKHARYNVRLAERADAKLAFYAPPETPINTFFDLMQTTAGRDSFSLQSREYYRAVLSSIPADSGFTVICTIDGKPAAAALFAAYDGVVHYVFAGSSNDFRKIAPPYFVVWNAIQEAKKHGWETLNFGGIYDEVKGTHLAGVTGFKMRFGGYQIDHANPVDLVYQPLRYKLFRMYKALRSH
jgi:hypothetical protein